VGKVAEEVIVKNEIPGAAAETDYIVVQHRRAAESGDLVVPHKCAAVIDGA